MLQYARTISARSNNGAVLLYVNAHDSPSQTLVLFYYSLNPNESQADPKRASQAETYCFTIDLNPHGAGKNLCATCARFCMGCA